MPDDRSDEHALPVWTVDDAGFLVWRGADGFSSAHVADLFSGEDEDRVSFADGRLLVRAVAERNLYAWLLQRLVANGWSEDFVADIRENARKALAEISRADMPDPATTNPSTPVSPLSTPPADCIACDDERRGFWSDRSVFTVPQRMIVCPDCGNKRCPKAINHRFICTASVLHGDEEGWGGTA